MFIGFLYVFKAFTVVDHYEKTMYRANDWRQWVDIRSIHVLKG